MILRKPYAFLIKHFQKINLALLLLACYIVYKNISFSNMVTNYLASGFYNPVVNPMSNYVSFFFNLSILAIIAICCVLIYLLYYKKKPVIVYGLIILEYVLVIIAFSFAVSYFNNLGFDIIDRQQALLVRDILFIVSIPQYAILIVLLIRSLGLDLKKFGFREDAEYIEINASDNEEFELSLDLDKHTINRTIKQKFRYIKYFFLEHKVVISLVLLVTFLASSITIYQTSIAPNRSYKMLETFTANSYDMRVNKVYFTNKDYAGDRINTSNRKYLILEIDITNKSNSTYYLDTGKFVIAGSKQYYLPIKTHDKYFKDLGNGYQDQPLKPNTKYTYLLIYEINPNDFGTELDLFYQEMLGHNKVKLRKINIKKTDISNYNQTITNKLNEEMSLAFSNKSVEKFTINNYEIKDEVDYLYTKCFAWDCRVYEGKLRANTYPNNKTILKLMFTGSKTGLNFNRFLIDRAKLIYKVSDKEVATTFISPGLSEWKGQAAYLLIPDAASSSPTLKLEFTVRDKLYIYNLKGE
ncbi:MAG: hypothetical protein RR047_02035 [Bacilli bacterium]